MLEANIEKGYIPVFRILTEMKALDTDDLNYMIQRILDRAIHISGRENYRTLHRRENGTIWIETEDIMARLKRWPSNWRGYPRKTEIFYILVPLKSVAALNDAVRFAEAFEYNAFGVDGEMDLRDNLYSLKQGSNGFEMHLLVNRGNGGDLLTFHKKATYSFEGARALLRKTALETGLKLAQSDEVTEGFTMSYREALAGGIDYRDFDRVDRLPTGIEIKAIAGVWGDNRNLRCLFELGDGRKVRREVYFQSGYELDEVGINGRSLKVGQKFEVPLVY